MQEWSLLILVLGTLQATFWKMKVFGLAGHSGCQHSMGWFDK